MQVKRFLSGDGYAFETITVADTAVGFTHATWGTDNHTHVRAVVTVTGGMMRYRYDGSNPTSTVGHILSSGDTIVIEGSINIVQFRAIRVGSNSGILSVTYERVEG